MKRIIGIFVGIVMIYNMFAVTIFAETAPTAKIRATLVGDSIPVAGEKFTVAISIENISSGLFVSGEIVFSYPADVVTPVRYTKTEPTAVTKAGQMIGGVTNRFSTIEYTGKFSTISKIDLNTGEGAVAVYIDINAEDQAAEILTDGKFNMLGFAFMLNDGYTYDDFYLNISEAAAFLTADKQTVSRARNGHIEIEGLGEEDTEVSFSNAQMQTSLLTMVNLQSAQTDTDDYLDSNISILYNNEYYESVLNADNQLNVNLTIANSGTVDADCVCYVAEYNADGCMVSMSRNSEISIPAGETVDAIVSKTFSGSNTAKAKIFLWENGTLVPIGESIILTAEGSDYYADTYADANAFEINKQICGKINIDNDVDVVKIYTMDAGNYIVKFSADSTATYILSDSAGNVITGVAVDGDCIVYNLSGDNVYYLKMLGNANNNYHIKPMFSETVTKNVGTEDSLNDIYDSELYEFTPATTGEYIITAVGTDGVEATLYNSNFQELASSNIADSNVSFKIEYNMTENTKYYIIVEQKTSETEPTEYEIYVEEPFEIISIQ